MVKKNLKISVLIRSFNEGKWIQLCLKKIQQQTIKPIEIIIIDNGSLDGTINLAHSKKGNIKIFSYKKKYIPGKILNYGISKCKGDFILILSAHCIPCDNDLIEQLIGKLLVNKNICATYGRQVSLNFSDDLTIRDLMLTYSSESRLQRYDSQFNNACSLIRKSEWKITNFSNSLTNLEDRYWASKKIKQKKFIFYAAEAKVFHYHGSHHDNNQLRLINTKKTILDKRNNFDLTDKNLNLKKEDIFPVYIHSHNTKKMLLKNLKKISDCFDDKFIILTKNLNLNNTNDYISLKRKKIEFENKNFYIGDVLYFYKKIILKYSQNKEYLLICSDLFHNISNNYLKKIVVLMNDYFPDTIYTAEKTVEPIFSNNEGKIIRLNTLAPSRKENSALFIAKRDHGIIIHISNLFKSDKFGGNIKLLNL